MMDVGYYLNVADEKELLTSILGHKKFHNLLAEMKSYVQFEFDVDSIEVQEGLKFDTLSPKRDVITAKAIDFKINEAISIRYITRYINGNVEDTSDFFTGYVVDETKEGDSTLFNQTIFRAANDTSVSIIKNTITEEVVAANKEQASRFKEEYNYDENYYPGQLLEQVNMEGPLDGCLAGGYIYCGAKCGGHPACKGTVSGINTLDNCCKKHDCCYTDNGVSWPNCKCDQRLCDCSQASGASKVDRYQVEATMCFVC